MCVYAQQTGIQMVFTCPCKVYQCSQHWLCRQHIWDSRRLGLGLTLFLSPPLVFQQRTQARTWTECFRTFRSEEPARKAPRGQVCLTPSLSCYGFPECQIRCVCMFLLCWSVSWFLAWNLLQNKCRVRLGFKGTAHSFVLYFDAHFQTNTFFCEPSL